MLSKTYKELLEFYQAKLQQHGLNNSQALSYNSRTTQELRFAQFLKLIPKSQAATVLDVGCGLGDFSEYLLRLGYSQVVYAGVDVVPEMIAGAKKKHPAQTFTHGDLFTSEITPHSYVVSSGALNIIYTTAAEQASHIEQAILKMWTLAKKGLAFNLLNVHSQHDFEQDSRFFYSDPAKVLQFCQKLDSRAQLIDNYLDYDFTIVMRKIS